MGTILLKLHRSAVSLLVSLLKHQCLSGTENLTTNKFKVMLSKGVVEE